MALEWHPEVRAQTLKKLFKNHRRKPKRYMMIPITLRCFLIGCFLAVSKDSNRQKDITVQTLILYTTASKRKGER
jgi:hypothetical protein